MALIFVPQYTLEFDTDAGTDITWELDILRSYDDADPTPPWITDGVTSLIGTESPISIDWQKDYDVYKPINGSRAKINLLVQNAGQYADFNNAGPFEYQVRLRYRDDMGINQEYWCGYITPLETNESVTTFPFEVNYTATDGLGLLQDRIVAAKLSANDISPIDTVLSALYETGLDIPVYIDSKIYEGSNDALISATTNANSFYKDEKLIDRITVKEAVEGYLSAFNCKIYQSNARWYITNVSTHGGSGTEESATFKRYEVVSGATEYTATTDSDSEDLIYNLNGTSTRDLIPVKDDLNLSIRRPLGSVECRPEGLVTLDVVQNGTFELVDGSGEPDDWTAHPDSLDQTLTTSSAIRLEGQRSLTTGRSRRSLDKSNEIWFQNEVGIDIDPSVDFELSIDMLGEILIDSGPKGGRNVLLSYQLFYDTPTSFEFNRLSFTDVLLLPTFIPFFQNNTVNRLYFDFNTKEWIVPNAGFSSSQGLNDTYNTVEMAGNDLDNWINDKVNVTAPNLFWDEKDEEYVPIERGQLFLRVFYLQTYKPRQLDKDKAQGNEEGTVRVYLDNIKIKSLYETDITQPTFERLQLDYNETQDYKPRFASGVNVQITQKLNPTDTYFRSGKTEALTLERIVTQQKLNDYRGGNTTDPSQSSLKYYEGSVINNTLIPFAPKDKLLINYANYTETASCIFNGGEFEVKKNIFKYHGYVPNQLTDIAAGDGTVTDGVPSAGFYPFNIDLVAQRFPGRSNLVAYTLGFVTETTNSDGGAVVDNGLLPLTQNNGSYIQITGMPGHVYPMELRLVPAANFIGNPAGCSVRLSTVDEPRPTSTAFAGDDANGTFKNSQGDVILPLSITIPENPEYEILYIDGSISPFTPEETPGVVPASVVIDWSSDLIAEGSLIPSSSTSPSYRTIFNTDGIPGSVVHFTYIIECTQSFVLYAGNFSIRETDTSLENFDARQVGIRSVAIDFEYTIPTTTESVSVTLIGSASEPSSITNPAYTYDVAFDTSGSNFTLFESENEFKGVEGTVVPYDIKVIPNEGYDLSATNFSHSTLPTGITRRADTTSGFAQNNQEVILPINVAIGAADAEGTITISGTPQTEPYSLTFLVNDVGSEGWTIDNSQKLQPYGITDFDDSIPTFTFYVSPNENMAFSDGDQAHIDNQVMADIDEAAIGLPESQFTIARTYVNTGDEPDDLNVGKIKCVVAGKFPVLTDLPNFPHQATVSINITGTAGISGATSPNDDFTITTTDGNVTIVLLNINGGWSLTPNTPIGTPVGGGSAFGVRYVGDAFDTFTTFSPNVGDVTNNVIYTTLSESREAREISIPVFPLGSATALFTIKLKKNAVTSAGTTSFATEPVLLTGGSFSTVFQYSDYQGQSRVVYLGPAITTQVCAIDGVSGVTELSNNGGTSVTPTTGSITCTVDPASGGETYAQESGSTNGFTIRTLTTAPSVGTADTIITLVPII